MRGTILPPAVAKDIYDILIAHAGASDSDMARMQFDAAASSGITEYRFGGKLGFGGKFWINSGRWYVNCYPEDETPAKRAIIEATNAQLTALKNRLENTHGQVHDQQTMV